MVIGWSLIGSSVPVRLTLDEGARILADVGYRGRLIFPVIARIARVDLATMSDNFDPVFHEARPIATATSPQEGAESRIELATIDLRAQVEDEAWETLRMMKNGDAARLELTIIMHFADLELGGYVDPETGDVIAPRVGDRLVGFYREADRTLIQTVPEPGLYCEEAIPRSHGLDGGTRNLLAVTFRDRMRSFAAGGGS